MSIGAIAISTSQKREIAAAPGVTGANEGLSLDGTIVQLGQLEGDPSDPAIITTNRAIPFTNGTFIRYTDTGFGIADFFMDWNPYEIVYIFNGDNAAPGLSMFNSDLSGQVFQIHWSAVQQCYTLGGAGAQIDFLTIQSFTGFDPSANLHPTALVHIAAGTFDPGNGQLKFDPAIGLNVPEVGVMEFLNDDLCFTRASGTRETIVMGVLGGAGPTPAAGTPTDFIGANGSTYLGEPNDWIDFVAGGTTYKIPVYT
jgi:hypothetical protein